MEKGGVELEIVGDLVEILVKLPVQRVRGIETMEDLPAVPHAVPVRVLFPHVSPVLVFHEVGVGIDVRFVGPIGFTEDTLVGVEIKVGPIIVPVLVRVRGIGGIHAVLNLPAVRDPVAVGVWGRGVGDETVGPVDGLLLIMDPIPIGIH